MKYTNKNEDGFGAVEALLIVVVVGLIGGLGWYTWTKQNNKTKEMSVVETQPTQVDTIENEGPCGDTPVEAQKSWEVATSSKQSFSMCVPGGWTVVSGIEAEEFEIEPPFDVVAGKTAVIENKRIGGTDGTRDQLKVFKTDRNYQGWTSPNSQKTTFALNDGTKGTRFYEKHVNVGEGIGPAEGEESYEYLFEKNGKHIHVVYTVKPGTQKHIETIESVLKTLTIQ